MNPKPEILKDLKVLCSELSAEQLVNVIKKFCSGSSNYDYMGDASKTYAIHIGAPACNIHAIYREPLPLLAFAEKNGGLYLANVVPKTVSEIGIQEYNVFLDEFAEEFKIYAQKQHERIRIKATTGQLELDVIIPSKSARKRFLDFLNNHPLSKHPLDIERLDLFTCVHSSYSRTPLDTELLYRYLTEVADWSTQDAGWCVNRINIGIDVLKVRKRWYA